MGAQIWQHIRATWCSFVNFIKNVGLKIVWLGNKMLLYGGKVAEYLTEWGYTIIRYCRNRRRFDGAYIPNVEDVIQHGNI